MAKKVSKFPRASSNGHKPRMKLMSRVVEGPTHFYSYYVTYVIQFPGGAVIFRGRTLMELPGPLQEPERIESMRAKYQVLAVEEYPTKNPQVTLLGWQLISAREMTDDERARVKAIGEKIKERKEQEAAAREHVKEYGDIPRDSREQDKPEGSFEELRRKLGWEHPDGEHEAGDAGARRSADNTPGAGGEHGRELVPGDVPAGGEGDQGGGEGERGGGGGES